MEFDELTGYKIKEEDTMSFRTLDMKKFAEHYQKIVIDNKNLLDLNEKLESENLRLKTLVSELGGVYKEE